jgi:hypothetical protein
MYAEKIDTVLTADGTISGDDTGGTDSSWGGTDISAP